jgi:CDP-diacylglycerol---glycerol-3-phosphate 3-phosphatidyltransferase
MTPNQVTLARVAAAFAAVALFTAAETVLAADLAAVLLTVAAIALDGVDGYLARTRGLATPLGAQLDILGDRVVENLFFTCFAVAGLISLWVPVVFFVRGAVTDFLRGLAARAGRSGFGGNSMLETGWGKRLVASRASRGAYATLKCVCFCYLGLLLPLRHPSGVVSDSTFGPWFAAWLSEPVAYWLLSAGRILTGVTILFCLMRAIPVVWEGRRYLTSEKPAHKPFAPATIR